MHIRTFRAANLQEALEQIRQQMGSEAAVLHTRQVRDGWMGWLGRTYVEVTAGLRDDDSVVSIAPASRCVDTRVAPDVEPRFVLKDVASLTDPALPLQLQAYQMELLAAGVDSDTVDRWLNTTVSFASSMGEAVSGPMSAGTPWLEHLQRTVLRELRIGSPILTHPGERRVVALVGPTGVGKTTTVAKLAAGFRIEARRRVGLLTIDTFRIAAVQQLKAYAEIMDLPMQVVERPDDMQPALDLLGDVDLVLIDTAGRSPKSDARIDQLVELLRSAQPDETHLVLNATSSAAATRLALKGFAPVRPTAAILTKLDEAPNTVGVLSALASSEQFSGIPLSYITNGQQVPDDIAPAEAEMLMSRLLTTKVSVSPLNAA
ncbi:flagellar biosynthesis protein FlhF [Rhodopirellula sp.]|nr:flagellar biosynthesis protein FlhF [Rubripirellula sp.]MDA7904842.1 flagellar biosynthesis protein FlhF [Rhodopirellula sp.]MDA8968258.1 flagellar biosynthesis protein FlhF [bacterium]MDB4557577.1 flagellar biosynthesis protein FlhF [bacterium]MDB4561616.1 flagellar biosynthesis protein FlhF [bacterium]MDB4644642.1 flagellar biosynthesis protein FlhF [Rubripirellula sp.]